MRLRLRRAGGRLVGAIMVMGWDRQPLAGGPARRPELEAKAASARARIELNGQVDSDPHHKAPVRLRKDTCRSQAQKAGGDERTSTEQSCERPPPMSAHAMTRRLDEPSLHALGNERVWLVDFAEIFLRVL